MATPPSRVFENRPPSLCDALRSPEKSAIGRVVERMTLARSRPRAYATFEVLLSALISPTNPSVVTFGNVYDKGGTE